MICFIENCKAFEIAGYVEFTTTEAERGEKITMFYCKNHLSEFVSKERQEGFYND